MKVLVEFYLELLFQQDDKLIQNAYPFKDNIQL